MERLRGCIGVMALVSSACSGTTRADGAGSGLVVGASIVQSRPALLSESGLFADIASDQIAPDVVSFVPRFPLWTDGARKRRWILLPEGGTLDDSDPDHWRFPIGTRLYKEFVRDGVRVETRLLEKVADAEWFAMAYAWNEAGDEAVAIPEGASDALGTGHDIPASSACATCHAGSPDFVLGFSALQLAEEELEPVVPAYVADIQLPGGATAQAALGYLHANCGGCHNPLSPVAGGVGMELRLNLADLEAVETTGAYRTAVAKGLIEAGDPEGSYLLARMAERTPGVQMPPLGTELVDSRGLEAVRAWVQELR
jgi:mono/diheme cytochrome c family protein